MSKIELVKFRHKNREDYSLFQQHFFKLGVKIHSERNSENLNEIAFNICDVIPEYKGTRLDRDVFGICLYEDEKGYYMQNVDSLNFNLSKKREIEIIELKNHLNK